ncbi:hypothetical protein HA466_0136510 [Hirschfeldia incana]|nr:hypothetical protein HA466_0136510 [Hirschfeldia incana]
MAQINPQLLSLPSFIFTFFLARLHARRFHRRRHICAKSQKYKSPLMAEHCMVIAGEWRPPQTAIGLFGSKKST